MSRRALNREIDDTVEQNIRLCLCDKPGCNNRARFLIRFSGSNYSFSCVEHEPEGSPVAIYELPKDEEEEPDPDRHDCDFRRASEL